MTPALSATAAMRPVGAQQMKTRRRYRAVADSPEVWVDDEGHYPTYRRRQIPHRRKKDLTPEEAEAARSQRGEANKAKYDQWAT